MPTKKPRPNARRVRMDIRVTASMKAEIEEKAKARGLSLHEFVRRRVLTTRTPVLPEYVALQNLQLHMDELKAAYAHAASDEVKGACLDRVLKSIPGLLTNSKGKGRV